MAGELLVDASARYRLLASPGKGGGGETFEAIRMTDGARLALKCLDVAPARERKRLEFFELEARVAAALNHSAVPRHGESSVVDSAKLVRAPR